MTSLLCSLPYRNLYFPNFSNNIDLLFVYADVWLGKQASNFLFAPQTCKYYTVMADINKFTKVQREWHFRKLFFTKTFHMNCLGKKIKHGLHSSFYLVSEVGNFYNLLSVDSHNFKIIELLQFIQLSSLVHIGHKMYYNVTRYL